MVGSGPHSKPVVEPGLDPMCELGNWSPRGRWPPLSLERLHCVSSSLTSLLPVFNPSIHTPTSTTTPSSEPGSVSCHLSLSSPWLGRLHLHTQSRLSHPGTISYQYFLSRGSVGKVFPVRVVCTSSSLLVFSYSMKFDP